MLLNPHKSECFDNNFSFYLKLIYKTLDFYTWKKIMNFQ